MTSTANLISMNVTPASTVTYALTTYTFASMLADMIPANGYIRITFPTTITFSNVTISAATFTTTSCVVSVNSSIVTINGCFSADMTTLNFSITLSGIYNPPSL